jgi:hypothetical protein
VPTFHAADEGGEQSGAAALADVVAGEAVGVLGGAGVETAEDAVGRRGELDVGCFDDKTPAEFDLVEAGEGGLASAPVPPVKVRHAGAEREVRAGVGDGPELRVDGCSVEGVGEECWICNVKRFLCEGEDRGGAVAGEYFGYIGGRLEVAGESDVVGELFDHCGFE